MKECNCGNPKYGFDCTCQHEIDYPGGIQYSCEFCGTYVAGEPRCNKCEDENKACYNLQSDYTPDC